jgi:hypothetical protein
LLLVFGSCWAAIVALFKTGLGVDSLVSTTSSTKTASSSSISPSSQVTIGAESQLPCVVLAETRVVPGGTASKRLTFSASSSPSTPTVIVYVIVSPAVTDAGAVLVTKASPR